MEQAVCVFCQIIRGDLPAKVIAETDDVLVIPDIHPQAPIHCLILPKKHIINLGECSDSDVGLLGSLLLMARKLARDHFGGIDFRLQLNNGKQAGQQVFHLHMHFLAQFHA